MQVDPAETGWALTINYAGDKHVRTAIARPDHAEAIKAVSLSLNFRALF